MYQIKTYNKFNRALLAAVDIPQGSLIFHLTPLVFALTPQTSSVLCNFCLKKQQLLKCSACKMRFYCSQQCQKGEWNRHKIQCQYIKKLAKNENKQQIMFVLSLYRQLKEEEAIKSQIDQMLALQQLYSKEEEQRLAKGAAFILNLLDTPPTHQEIVTLVNLQKKIRINVFSVQDQLLQGVLGQALYYPANFLNHHCNPNAVQLFRRKHLLLIARKDIKKGQEITISYVDRTLSHKARNQSLRLYRFKCNCERCLAERLVGQALLCPECSQVLSQRKKYNCSKCERSYEGESKHLLEQCSEMLRMMQGPNCQLPVAQKCFQKIRGIVPLTNPLCKPGLQLLYQLYLAKIDQQTFIAKAYQTAKLLLKSYKVWLCSDQSTWFQPIVMWKQVQTAKLAHSLHKSQRKIMRLLQSSMRMSKLWLDCESEQAKQLNQLFKEMQTKSRLYLMKNK